MLKLSIITVNLNNAAGLRKTIESVVNQTFTDYEYIIIDGGSTDGSVEIIKEYADKITYWVSEPDKGIYNAMNKGIKVAKGEYCLFLNSGDWLLLNSTLFSFFSKFENYDILYGNVMKNYGLEVFPHKLTLSFFYLDTICHQAAIIRTKLFKEIGFYNENLKIAADWEFFIKAIFINNFSYKYIDVNISNYEGNGLSSTVDSRKIMFEEKKNTFRKYFPNFFDDYELFYINHQELMYYRNSKLIQVVKKIQFSKFYKRIRNVK
jgi:glycosyltransferase involved in cell wall biosynthesis